MTIATIAVSTVAGETGFMVFLAYKLMTAPEGYEDSSGFHYVSPPVESAGSSHRAEVVDSTRARRPGRPAKV